MASKEHHPGSALSLNTMQTDSTRKSLRKKKRAAALQLANASACAQLREDVEKDMVMHELSTLHFSARQYIGFTVPQAVLTLISSVMAFLATASFVNKDGAAAMSTIVGCLSAVVVFLQTLSGNCKYEERATMHDTMATNLRGLQKHLSILENKLKLTQGNSKEATILEKEGGDDEDDDDDEEEGKAKDPGPNTFEWIADQQRQFLAGCKSRCPLEIKDAFDMLNSRIKLHWGEFNIDEKAQNSEEVIARKEQIMQAAVDILSSEIQSHRGFPFMLPSPRITVMATLRTLNKEINDETKDFKVDPKGCLSILFPCISNSATGGKETSLHRNESGENV